jgi:DNA modification methylase
MPAQLFHGDCLIEMAKIPDKSIDMCLTDPPYGTTACKWDVIISFEHMWKELNRIIKPTSAICLFGTEPFSSKLIMSNINNFKYNWYLRKNHASGVLNCKKMPLYKFELCSVFGNKINYYPILQSRPPTKTKVNSTGKLFEGYNKIKIEKPRYEVRDYTYPNNEIEFKRVVKNRVHPTQKPVDLLEYLIKTYTMEGETVLDFTMGSGSTGVACKNLNRNFIGVEKDEKYFQIAEQRINE